MGMDALQFARELCTATKKSDPMLDYLASKLIEDVGTQVIYLARFLDRQGCAIPEPLKKQYEIVLHDVIMGLPAHVRIEVMPDIIQSIKKFASGDAGLLQKIKETLHQPSWLDEPVRQDECKL